MYRWFMMIFAFSEWRFSTVRSSKQRVFQHHFPSKTDINMHRSAKKRWNLRFLNSPGYRDIIHRSNTTGKFWSIFHFYRIISLKKHGILQKKTGVWSQKNSKKSAKAMGPEECSFNVLEAFVSAVGMGDDLNAIIRTCPPPRDGESELACQVNGAILVAWVGNLATKLALAASNCALSTNVDAAPWIEMTFRNMPKDSWVEYWAFQFNNSSTTVLPCFECLMNVWSRWFLVCLKMLG